MEAREEASEIAKWLYGPDEGLSEGLVRTLIDKIESALLLREKEGYERGCAEEAEKKRSSLLKASEGMEKALEEAVKCESICGQCQYFCEKALEEYQTLKEHNEIKAKKEY